MSSESKRLESCRLTLWSNVDLLEFLVDNDDYWCSQRTEILEHNLSTIALRELEDFRRKIMDEVPSDWEFYEENPKKESKKFRFRAFLTKTKKWLEDPDSSTHLIIITLVLAIVVTLVAIWIPLDRLANTALLAWGVCVISFIGWFFRRILSDDF